MERYETGERVVHDIFGLGTVVAQHSDEIVVVDFPNKGKTRLFLKFAPLRSATQSDEDAMKPGGKAYQKWINSTFAFETEDAEHYQGSHWEPFFDDTRIVFDRLQEIMPKALLQVSYAENHPPLRSCPAEWPQGVHYTWPLRVRGLAAVSRINPEDRVLRLTSVFPFDSEGCQHQLVLEKVHVWQSEVEAQVECTFGPTSITFFDTLYAANRLWYEAGKTYQFVLTGVAYECRMAKDEVFQALNPPLPEDFKAQHPEVAANWPGGDTIPVHTSGMAALFPITQWDRDDYSFRGPIKALREVTLLDQPCWKARVTVLRDNAHGGNDLDVDVIVTRKVWGENPPPRVGDDLEGALWLQGYLWSV